MFASGTTLPLRVRCQLSCEGRLEREAPMRRPISIPVPSTAIPQTGSKCEAVPSLGIRKLLIELPGVVTVANVAIGSAKGRISLQVNGGDSTLVECIRYSDGGKDRAKVLRLITAGREVA